jgi:HEAT repeat protein
MESLLTRLTAGSDEDAEEAIQALVKTGALALPAVKELLDSGIEDARWWGVRALAEIDHPETRALLIEALADPALTVRQCAALALREHPHVGAVSAIQSALDQEDRLLARLAADALVALGNQSTPALLAVLAAGCQVGRVEAARALALLTDPRAVPALFAALDDESPLIEHWADQGLQRRGIGMTFFEF